MRSGPLRFLFGIALLWAIVRAAMLWPAEAEDEAVRRIAWAPLPPVRAGKAIPIPARPIIAAIHFAAADPPPPSKIPVPHTRSIEPPDPPLSPAFAVAAPVEPPLVPKFPILALSPKQSGKARLSLSAWTIIRPATSVGGLAAAGQLGGSQAGARLRFGNDRVGIAARLSAPLQNPAGQEAALGVDWRPLRAVPVAFTVERRFALDRGGRNAFAAGAFGGFGGKRIGGGFVADGYAQAGLVGFRRHDAYIDGALRLEHPLARSGRFSLAAGAGLWGSAQPGASRLDIGPQLIARVPLGGAAVRIGAEWRERIAGNARPGSGPALSLGADF